jgi:hypothetical protein
MCLSGRVLQVFSYVSFWYGVGGRHICAIVIEVGGRQMCEFQVVGWW